MDRGNLPPDEGAPKGRFGDGTPRKRAYVPRGRPLDAAAADAAARGTTAAGGTVGPQPAAQKAPDGPCGICGQGGNKVCACGRKVSPLTREATDALALQGVMAWGLALTALAGDKQWRPDQALWEAFRKTSQEAAWIYRVYLDERLILLAMLGLMGMTALPALEHRKAAETKKKAAAEAARANGGAGAPVGVGP